MPTIPKPFTCHGCGDEFDTDPRLGVACPTCAAPAGSPCKSPSGYSCTTGYKQPHSPRRKLAFEQNPCSCLANWEKAQREAGAEMAATGAPTLAKANSATLQITLLT
jgi:hypothetical protein